MIAARLGKWHSVRWCFQKRVLLRKAVIVAILLVRITDVVQFETIIRSDVCRLDSLRRLLIEATIAASSSQSFHESCKPSAPGLKSRPRVYRSFPFRVLCFALSAFLCPALFVDAVTMTDPSTTLSSGDMCLRCFTQLNDQMRYLLNALQPVMAVYARIAGSSAENTHVATNRWENLKRWWSGRRCIAEVMEQKTFFLGLGVSTALFKAAKRILPFVEEKPQTKEERLKYARAARSFAHLPNANPLTDCSESQKTADLSSADLLLPRGDFPTADTFESVMERPKMYAEEVIQCAELYDQLMAVRQAEEATTEQPLCKCPCRYTDDNEPIQWSCRYL